MKLTRFRHLDRITKTPINEINKLTNWVIVQKKGRKSRKGGEVTSKMITKNSLIIIIF